MLGFLQGVGGFIFIFGIVVFVHELGHFLAAKLTGVYAPKFSIGFGPGPSKKWGETQYILGLIPLGGYVRMASRDDEATAFLEGGSEESAARRQESGDVPRTRDWDPNALIPFGPHPVPAHPPTLHAPVLSTHQRGTCRARTPPADSDSARASPSPRPLLP